MIVGIAMAAIMLALVFAAMIPMVSAESRGDNFNYIVKQYAIKTQSRYKRGVVYRWGNTSYK